MKRFALFLLCLVMLLSLCACARKADKYDVILNKKTYTVDPVEKTIYDGSYTYRYEFSDDSENYDSKIYYPDGTWYTLDCSGYIVDADFSDHYREGQYAKPRTLGMVVPDEKVNHKPFNPMKWVTIILCLGVGLFLCLNPEAAWQKSTGWKFKNAEPSEAVLLANQGCGAVLMILGVILFFVL